MNNTIRDEIMLRLDRLTATLRWLRDTSYRLDQDLSGAIDLAAAEAARISEDVRYLAQDGGTLSD